jgi:hypothetical protein
MKQTLYIVKHDGGEPQLSTVSMQEYSWCTLLGTTEVEFEVPELNDADIAQRQIDSLYEQAAELRTVSKSQIETFMSQVRYLKAQQGNALKEYNTGSTTTADEKAMLVGAI